MKIFVFQLIIINLILHHLKRVHKRWLKGVAVVHNLQFRVGIKSHTSKKYGKDKEFSLTLLKNKYWNHDLGKQSMVKLIIFIIIGGVCLIKLMVTKYGSNYLNSSLQD